MSKWFQAESSEAGAGLALTGETPEQQVEECYTILQQASQKLQQAQETLKATHHREQLRRQITSQIRTSLDLDAILQGAVSATRELLQVESCHFAWYRSHANLSGWETIQEAKLPHGPSCLGWYAEADVQPLTEAILNQELLRVSDVETLEQPELQRVFRKLGIKSHLALPIRTHSGAVGTLNCTNFSELRLWSDEDVEWLQDVLDQLAIAIHQAELDADLRTSKAHLEAFFTTANAGLVIFDRQLRYVNINEALAETNGIPAAEHIGKPIREVLPQLASTLEPMFQDILDTGKPVLDYELIGETPKQPGVTRYWLASYYPLFDKDGSIFGVGGVVIEITDRKQTEAALQEQTNLLQLILQSMSDGIVVANEQGQFLVFNPAAEQMFGHGATDTQTDEWSQQYGLFLADQVTPFPADELPLVRVIRGEESKDVEFFVRHAQAPDGRWVFANARPLRDESGQLKGGVAVCRDVTDRKQAEAALAESEAKFRYLVENATDLIWSSTLEGILTYLSPSFKEISGFELSEFVGRSLEPLVHPDDLPACLAFLNRVAETGEQQSGFEFKHQHQDGSWFWASANASPIKNELGEVVGFQGIVQNTEERKQAENALKQSEERYRSLTTATSQIVWMADVEGRVADIPAWRVFTGQTEAEVAGFGWLNATHPDDRERTGQVWLQAVQTKSLYETEYRIRAADGSYRYFAARGVPVLNEDDSIREWVGTCTDIHDRKQAEIALRQSEEQLQAILDNSPAVFYMKDPQGQFMTVNRQFESLFHRSKAEIIGKRNHELFDKDLADIFDANDRKVLEAGTAMQWEEVAPHDDGLHTYLSLKFPLLAPDGSPYAICGMSTDITDRKQVEISLAQAKEAAEAANRAKSEFLANMSHELRTPLNGVIGYAQILQRAKTLSEEDRSRIEVIHQCGSHLLTLINDILDLSKIEARKTELSPSDFHLPAFLQGVAEMCRIRAELKKIQFRYQSAPELPLGIQADEKRLRQVLINLLSNAIKFTDAGSVTFTISFASEGKIRFEVRDTGIGIPQDKLEAIFQPFEQVSDVKRQSEGTGLGLAISQEIVGLMDSTIQVQSEIGVGSIFWFDVNLPEAAEWVRTSQSDRHGQIIGIKGRQPKILVVDDKWENRSVVSKLLSPIGFDVVEAATGLEGWHRAVEFQPDLIITDLMMPHMDGFKLIKQIRESETLKDLIIIVSSASVFEADQYRSIEAGGNDFLPKPVLAAELLQKLQKHLKLEWLYEDQPSSISSVTDNAELIPPPAAELETLYELTMKGSFRGILKQAALIEQMDQKYSPFAKKLHQLAKGFQDQAILALIQPYR